MCVLATLVIIQTNQFFLFCIIFYFLDVVDSIAGNEQNCEAEQPQDSNKVVKLSKLQKRANEVLLNKIIFLFNFLGSGGKTVGGL